MSGVRPQHLQRRGGTYHLRVRVPDDVRARVGVLEVRRSLHVHRLPEARHLALKYAARLMEVFAMTRTHALTKDQTRELVVTCFADLTRAADHPFVPSSDRPDMEIEEQQCIAATRSAEWTEQVQTGQFDGIVRNHADRVLQTGNMRLHDLSERLQQDVLEGTARALMEQQRLFVFRLNDRLTPYRPTDPLFAGVAYETLRQQAMGTITPALPHQFHGGSQGAAVGPKIGDLISKYLAAKKSSWAPKTLDNRRHQLRYLVEQPRAYLRTAS